MATRMAGAANLAKLVLGPDVARACRATRIRAILENAKVKRDRPPRHTPTGRQPTPHTIVLGGRSVTVAALTRSEARAAAKKIIAEEERAEAERERAERERVELVAAKE